MSNNVPGKYLVTIRHGGWHHIRPHSDFADDTEAKAYQELMQEFLRRRYNSRQGRSKGAKPFVYVWKLID